jgi:hypothetical protein
MIGGSVDRAADREYAAEMSRESVLLAALTAQPTSTTELYSRIGYASLTQIGLIPYPPFRAELAKLAEAGLVESVAGSDGATLWRLASPRE